MFYYIIKMGVFMRKKKKSTISKRGRPSPYQNVDIEQLKKIAALGATDSQIADFFKVSVSTLNLWKEKHPEFSESLKEAKALSDERVERSLFQRACGFEHESEEIFCNKQGMVTRVKTIKKYAPDTIAAIFWLTNRQKDKWRDSRSIDHTTGGKEIDFSTKSDKELAQLILDGISAAASEKTENKNG
jgi:hypothetical protein